MVLRGLKSTRGALCATYEPVFGVESFEQWPRPDLTQIREQLIEEGRPVEILNSVTATRLKKLEGNLPIVPNRRLPTRDFQESRLEIAASLQTAYVVPGVDLAITISSFF